MREAQQAKANRWLMAMVPSLAALVVGCASTNVPPLHESPDALLSDEQVLWESADALVAEIRDAGTLVDDPELVGYLNSLTSRLLGSRSDGLRRPVIVAVLLSPDTNAFMLANGQMYITTGLLARTENEAQVATILGHEIVHYLNRHGLKGVRTAANERLKTALLAGLAAGIGGAVGGQAVGQSLGNLASSAAQQWELAARSGYSQALEQEADDLGFRMLVEAGFDGREAPAVFSHLMEQLREDGVREPYFYATHPRLADRLHRYQVLSMDLTASPHGRPGYQDTYEKLRLGVLLRNAPLNVANRRLRSAKRELETAERLGGRSGRTAFLLGEVERLGSPSGTTPRALTLFLEAVTFPDAPPEAYREAGLALRENQQGNPLPYLEEYLIRAPGALDTPLIKGIISQGG